MGASSGTLVVDIISHKDTRGREEEDARVSLSFPFYSSPSLHVERTARLPLSPRVVFHSLYLFHFFLGVNYTRFTYKSD
jgi:hypothetical protein